MSYSVSAFHNPEFGCELNVSSLTGGQTEIIMRLGAFGCNAADTDQVTHDQSAGNTYGDVRAMLAEFRGGHASVDDGGVAGNSSDSELTAAASSNEALTPLGAEEQNYRTTIGLLTGAVELPEGVDKQMVMEAWMRGVDVNALVAVQDSTIAQ